MKNEIMTTQNNPAIVIHSVEEANKAFSIANLIFHPTAMEKIEMFAAEMAKSKNLLPAAFVGNKELCKSLLIKAGSLNMDPFAIGAHAFQSPNGIIGFEAKVYQSIAMAAGGIKFTSEYGGDWAKVIGNSITKTSQTSNKKYQAAGWTAQDEKGLFIDLTGTYKNGESDALRVYMSECHPRLSTNWVNNPRMQVFYSAVKQWLRRNRPDLIMGIFDNEDIEAKNGGQEIELNPIPSTKNNDITNEPIEDINDLINEPEPQPEKEEIQESDFSDIDDLIPSSFSMLQDLVSDIDDSQSYKGATEAISQAIANNELSDGEIEGLRTCVRAARREIGLE